MTTVINMSPRAPQVIHMRETRALGDPIITYLIKRRKENFFLIEFPRGIIRLCEALLFWRRPSSIVPECASGDGKAKGTLPISIKILRNIVSMLIEHGAQIPVRVLYYQKPKRRSRVIREPSSAFCAMNLKPVLQKCLCEWNKTIGCLCVRVTGH